MEVEIRTPQTEESPKDQKEKKSKASSGSPPAETGSLSSSLTSPGIKPDPSNFEVKHPLQHRWTLWFDNPGKKTSQASWADHLRQIMTIDTVEDFWRLQNNIVPASGLALGSNYHFFKEKIEPKWEDPANSKGGKWVVTIPSKNRREYLDRLWLWTLLACIGEVWEEEDEICGCVVSIRKTQDKVALWTKSGNDEGKTVRVGRRLKQVLELQDNTMLGYQVHSDALARNSSFGNQSRYKL